MKYFIIFFLLAPFGLIEMKGQKKYLTVFFVNQFRGDSVDIYADKKKIESAKLSTIKSTGQCEFFLVVEPDKIERLIINDLKTKQRFEILVEKDSTYLYIFKLENGRYRFDYSTKLILPL